MSEIALNFGKAALTYDQVASVQLASARHLAQLIPRDSICSASQILDVGTGTGYMAEILCEANPSCHITLNDISPTMLTVAGGKLHHFPNLNTLLGDAESMSFSRTQFDFIVSNMAVQWFCDWQAGLKNLLSQTKNLAFSTLTNRTFSEWQQAHDRLGLLSGLHRYPAIEELTQSINNLSSRPPIMDTKVFELTFDYPRDFVRYLTNLGAHTPHSKYSPSTLARVLPTLKAPFTISYEIFYAVLTSEES